MTSALVFESQQFQLSIDVEIAVPVFNEERALSASILRLHAYLSEHFPLTWLITIADNASTDRTWAVACRLTQELDGVRAVRLEQKGRGGALRAVWSQSHAAVVAYMDVDLSTDLAALLPLVAPLLSGHSEVAIGSRLARGAVVVRGAQRELISRAYNLILNYALASSFSDAQCGFKAVRADVARGLLPLIMDNGWFFDTELLVLAERNGLRIHEVPVDWIDDPDSRVDVVSTAVNDLRGVTRMLRAAPSGRGVLPAWSERADDRDTQRSGHGPNRTSGEPTRQALRFARIGAVSTVMFAVLFTALYGLVGPFLADTVALTVCGAANLAANRRFTFSVHGRTAWARHYMLGTVVGVLPLLTTLTALAALKAIGGSGLGVDLSVVTGANLAATAGRFILLRRWVFKDRARFPCAIERP